MANHMTYMYSEMPLNEEMAIMVDNKNKIILNGFRSQYDIYIGLKTNISFVCPCKHVDVSLFFSISRHERHVFKLKEELH